MLCMKWVKTSPFMHFYYRYSSSLEGASKDYNINVLSMKKTHILLPNESLQVKKNGSYRVKTDVGQYPFD